MKCQWRDCTKEATHHPKVMVPEAGFSVDMQQPIGATLSLLTCHEHCMAVDAQAFLNTQTPSNNGTHKGLFHMQAGGRRLDFDRAFIHAVPLDSEEAIAMAKQLENVASKQA